MSKLREIPPVSEVIESLLAEPWSERYSRKLILAAIREELTEVRLKIKAGLDDPISLQALNDLVRQRLAKKSSYSLKKVINATGIIVHTNLGRAPLAKKAIEHLREISEGYSNLEFDLEQGHRGSREKHLERLLSSIIPAEASLVVNNNAASLLLILNTLAEGKEVIVSRGELVEIGGSFRLPEIMKKSAAILKEVGTTNKTRISDYRDAINEKTGLILSVHPSNFQIIGFTEKPQFSELASLAAEFNIPLVEDHGSGILINLERAGISEEPQLTTKLEEGADVVCFSGDKILGGPQCGIVCGKKELIKEMHSNPLFRVLRVSKVVYAALEATAQLYLNDEMESIPVIRMLNADTSELNTRAEKWCEELRAKFANAEFKVEATTCFIGGGVAPMKGLPSFAVSVVHPEMNSAELAAKLRHSKTPVIARIDEDRLFFELRTLTEEDQKTITTELTEILK
ncbi:MAG TPA: L-seryl-tRNA(Sec) selenium transferase [Acidobacteriota bacterium]